MCKLIQARKEELEELFYNMIEPNFPEDEIKPLEIMEKLMDTGYYKIFYLEEEGVKKGIACLNTYPDGASFLLDYLAIQAAYRSQGLGSRILKLCKEYLNGKPMLIETEAVFAAKSPEESRERIRRNAFYRSNGAVMTKAVIRMFGVIFTMWTLYDEQGMSKESIETEMEKHYRFMLVDPKFYEDNAEIPYQG